MSTPTLELKPNMEKCPSTHRFQVAKVEFSDENKSEADETKENGSIQNQIQHDPSIDSPTVTFSIPRDSYTDGQNQNTCSYTTYGQKTFGKNTTEALPHVDHYRNLLSATSALKTRPTLAELHEEKVKYNYFLLTY